VKNSKEALLIFSSEAVTENEICHNKTPIYVVTEGHSSCQKQKKIEGHGRPESDQDSWELLVNHRQ